MAWGIFFVWIGLSWIVTEYYGFPKDAYIAFGVGIILIGLNAARVSLGLKLSKFSLFIGVVALAFGGTALTGFKPPLANDNSTDRFIHNCRGSGLPHKI